MVLGSYYIVRWQVMYRKRLIDSQLEYYKKSPFALLVEGAKATGKTTTCMLLTERQFHLDKELQRNVVEATNHSILFDGDGSVLIDEWQFLPDVWNSVRRKVDERTFEGTIFLTGSSPSLQPWVHSGSGRILRFKMRPLSIEEREIETPRVRISELLKFPNEDNFFAETEIGLEDYLDEIYSSGFPGIRSIEEQSLRNRSLESYVDNIIHHDFGENSIVIRKPSALKAWLRAYSGAIATTTNSKTIADAAFSDNEESLAKTTLQSYRDLLKGIGVTEEVEPWLPLGKLFKNLGKSSKHFLVDPALAVSLLSVSKQNLLMGRRLPNTIGSLNKTFIGQLFESLVYQSLAVYSDINEAKISHFRMRAGEKEIDFIIQKEDLLIAVEVKTKATVDNKDVANLNWFEQRIGDEYDVVKLIVTTGTYSYRRKEDGVIVCPLALLGC